MTDQVIDDLHLKRDQLPNLQLLEGPENISKSGQDPNSWATSEYSDPTNLTDHYLDRNALPAELPATPQQFDAFYEDRRALLVQLIKKTLSRGSCTAVGD